MFQSLDDSFDDELELLNAERSIVEAVQEIGTTSADDDYGVNNLLFQKMFSLKL